MIACGKSWDRKVILISLILVPAAAAYANPSIYPRRSVPFIAVVCIALCFEVFITSRVLYLFGLARKPTLIFLAVGNIASYMGMVSALAYHRRIPFFLVQLAVILAETAFIKWISRLRLLQRDSFIGLKWRSALFAAFVGNACSYYVSRLVP